MFDIGWTELFVVVVVAVIVVGPKDLPKMMRVVGRWTGRARAMADQFRRSFDDMARQAELEEMRAEVMKVQNEKTLAEMQRETDEMLGYIPPNPETPLPAKPKTPAPSAQAAGESAPAASEEPPPEEPLPEESAPKETAPQPQPPPRSDEA